MSKGSKRGTLIASCNSNSDLSLITWATSKHFSYCTFSRRAPIGNFFPSGISKYEYWQWKEKGSYKLHFKATSNFSLQTPLCCNTAAALCQHSLSSSKRKSSKIRRMERGWEIWRGKKCQFTSLTSIQQEIYQLLTNTSVHFFLTMVSHPLANKFYPFLFKQRLLKTQC